MILPIKRAQLKFAIREFSGAMGDFGTLIPLATGYIVVCGLDPGALLISVGILSVITGLIFKLPLPIEPMKVLAVVAIAQAWSPEMIYASAFAMGLIWIILSTTGLVDLLAAYTPHPVVRGIQAALGVLLVMQAFRLIATWWLLGIAALLLALLMRKNRYIPAVLILVAAAIAVAFYQGLELEQIKIGFNWPLLTRFHLSDLWPVMLLAGFAQIPLTAANAVISTASITKTYWPERDLPPRALALSIGCANLLLPFIGGMPICHGAGGLAAKYYFGARTGYANILLGIVEIALGLFLAAAAAALFMAFPEAIIGAMLLLVGVELITFVRDSSWGWQTLALAATVIISVLTNMALGFISGLILYYLVAYIVKQGGGKPPRGDNNKNRG